MHEERAGKMSDVIPRS